MAVILRPVVAEDQVFLYRVYAESHAADVAHLDWDESEKQAFLRMKFKAQDHFYHHNFPNADYSIVLLDDTPIGRIYIDRTNKAEFHLLNIALLPEYRGRGVGAELIQRLINEARDKKARIRINIEQANRARKLYERFGFKTLHHRGIYDYMEWSSTKSTKGNGDKHE